nr:hypothetical protein BaRGS_021669 [Batillaria attramentaria]
MAGGRKKRQAASEDGTFCTEVGHKQAKKHDAIEVELVLHGVVQELVGGLVPDDGKMAVSGRTLTLRCRELALVIQDEDVAAVAEHPDPGIILVVEGQSWTTAEMECEARHGHLVIVRDAATNQFLYNTLKEELNPQSRGSASSHNQASYNNDNNNNNNNSTPDNNKDDDDDDNNDN